MRMRKFAYFRSISLFFLLFSYSSGYSQTKLLPPINTEEFTEYAPTISSDGKTMIFQSDRDGKWNLYESKINKLGRWSLPKSLEKINSFRDSLSLIGGPSLSYDGNVLYFFASNKEADTEDIFYSLREGESWGEPIALGEPINSNDYEAFPSIAADGSSMFFTKKSKLRELEGETCYEIYRTTKNREGKWTEPLALPPPINLGCERAPRIMSDGKTLIFSSIREGGKGNFDLYVTQLQDNLEWTNPVNMDFVNTAVKDQFGAVSAAGDRLYINQEETSHDIFYYTIPNRFRQNKNKIIQGYVTDKYTKAPLSAKLQIFDASTTEELFDANTNPSDGWYSIVLTEGKNYDIRVSAQEYSDEEFSYDFTVIDSYEEITKNIQLFSHVKLEVMVYDKDRLELTDANLMVKNAISGSVLASLGKRTTDGIAILNLPIDGKYIIDANEENYIGDSFSFDLTSLVRYEDFEQDMEIDPLKLDFTFIVRDKETQEGISAQIILENKFKEILRIMPSEGVEGTYKKELRDGFKYEVEVEVPDKAYFSYTNNIYPSSKTGVNELIIELTEIKKDLKFTLKHINYEYNSAELLQSSHRDLSKVIKLLRDYEGVAIEISAHTDSDGSDAYNLSLSEKRAESVVNYLIQYGISTDRLTPKGYGETQPMAPNDSDENKALNRRVEMKILKVEIE